MNSGDQNSNMLSKNLFKILGLISAAALIYTITIFSIYLSKFQLSGKTQNSDWATFGDFVGGSTSPILSFLGLIALLITISLQAKELEATRKQLERAADAQTSTDASFKEQLQSQKRLQFEGTFFSLLDQHNKTLEKLTSPSEEWSKRRSTIEFVRDHILSGDIETLADSKADLEKLNQFCGHYFRTLYQLLKFIATNCPGSEIGENFTAENISTAPHAHNEKMYANIARAFMNHATTQVLAINCYCKDSQDAYWLFKLLIERYSFLEHMPFRVRNQGHRNLILTSTTEFYSEKAFEKSVYFLELKQEKIGERASLENSLA